MKIVKRILYVLLIIVIIPIYLVSIFLYVPIIYSLLAILGPFSWIVAGDKGTEFLAKILLEKDNSDLWLNESRYYSTFRSVLPLWGPFIIEKIRVKLDI